VINIQKTQQFTGHNAAIYALLPGRRPGTFLSAAGDGWIVEWELDKPDLGKLLAKVEVQVFSLAYFAATDTLIAGDMNGGVHWLNLSEDRPNQHWSHHQKGTFGILPLGDYVYTIGGDGVLTRWDALRQRSQDSLRLTNQPLRSIAQHHDTLAIGSSDHHIYLLDRHSLEILTKWRAHQNSVFSLAYSADGQRLFSGSRDAHLKVWLADTGKILSTQPAHLYTINDIILHPSGDYALTASRDRTIKIWDTDTVQLLKVLDTARDGGHINSVNCLCWIPLTHSFVSAGDDRTIIRWQIPLPE